MKQPQARTTPSEVAMPNPGKGKRVRQRIPILPGLFHEATSPDDKSYLIGSKCGTCGRTFFPPRPVCRVCLEEDTMTEIHLSARGKIETFAVINVAPKGFKAPYAQAYVELPEGVRVFSLMTGCKASEDALHPGMEAELVIDRISKDEQGNDLIGYKFRPVKQGKKPRVGKDGGKRVS